MRSPKLSAVLVAGARNAGKTTYLAETALRAKARGYSLGGFLSLAEVNDRGKNRYYLEDLTTRERRLLAWRTDTPNRTPPAGPFHFDHEVFDWAKNRITENLDADLIILDEYGPLEQRRGGHYPAIAYLRDHYTGIVMISVRPDLVQPLKNLFTALPEHF